jgi:hypothetical protein
LNLIADGLLAGPGGAAKFGMLRLCVPGADLFCGKFLIVPVELLQIMAAF